jgi:hypothetical protein
MFQILKECHPFVVSIAVARHCYNPATPSGLAEKELMFGQEAYNGKSE